MWFWGLVAVILLTALFLVITLAQFEAGARGKYKWLVLTFCSLAVVAGLIFLKPKVNFEQVDYQLASPLIEEAPLEVGSSAVKNNNQKSTKSGNNTSSSDKSRVSATKPDEENGESKIREQLNKSLQNKNSPDEIAKYSDPVLKEILELKLMAEEKVKTTEATGTEMTNDNRLDNQIDEIEDSGEQSIEKKSELKEQNQVVKARILVSSLNVRGKGSLDGQIIATLSYGDVVEVLNETETGDWINIRLNTGKTGWVMRNYIKILS